MSEVTKTASDTISLTDAIGLGRAYGTADTFSFADAIARFGYTFVLSDTFTILDFAEASLFRPTLTIIDTLNLAETVNLLATYATTLTDTLALSDLLGLSRDFAFVDSYTLTEALRTGRGNQPAGESFNFLDAVTIALGTPAPLQIAQSVNDSFLLQDSVAFQEPARLGIGDRVILADEVGVVLQAILSDYLRRYLNDV